MFYYLIERGFISLNCECSVVMPRKYTYSLDEHQGYVFDFMNSLFMNRTHNRNRSLSLKNSGK